MKESIRQRIIGQKIVRVTYFELNDLDHAVYFEDFDNFDLGIDLEFSNGFHWHIGWHDNAYHEAEEGKYIPIERLYPHKQIDATNRWARYLNSTITEFEVIFVNSDWKIPSKCSIEFNQSESISIFLGEELNVDGSLPDPLRFYGGGEIYVFHSRPLPSTELVEIILLEKSADEIADNTMFNESLHSNALPQTKPINLTFVLVIFIISVLIIIKLTLEK